MIQEKQKYKSAQSNDGQGCKGEEQRGKENLNM